MPNVAGSGGDGHHGRGARGAKPSTARAPGAARARLGPLIVAAVAAVVLGGGAALLTNLSRTQDSRPTTLAGSVGRTPEIGGPFAMLDQNGRPADQRRLLGRWSAVFFGYVSCPDTCPATLQVLQAVQHRLPADDAKRFQVVFVSVDPARDRPAGMKAYLDQPDFPADTLGLTGSPAQVAAIARAYRVYYATAPRRDGGYDVDHSAAIYLMDPRGRFAEVLSEAAGPDAIVVRLREAIRKG